MSHPVYRSYLQRRPPTYPSKIIQASYVHMYISIYLTMCYIHSMCAASTTGATARRPANPLPASRRRPEPGRASRQPAAPPQLRVQIAPLAPLRCLPCPAEAPGQPVSASEVRKSIVRRSSEQNGAEKCCVRLACELAFLSRDVFSSHVYMRAKLR